MPQLIFFQKNTKSQSAAPCPCHARSHAMTYKKMRSGINNIKAAPHLKYIFRRVITAETQTSPAILPLLLHLQTCLQPHRS